MKNFKLLIASFVIAICTGFSSCTDEYDDSEIWKKVNELLGRVQKLEAVCEQQNSNIVALQTMLNTLKDNVYVTSVEELSEGKGYMMKFSNGESVNIYHGKQGDSPQITIVKEGDSYYWAVNGEILKDEEGNNVSADGGSSETLPKLKTGSQLEADNVEGKWNKESIYVSVDNISWTEITTGSSNQIFTSVEVSEDNMTVNVTLSDGSIIMMPKTEKILEMLYGTWKSETNNGTWTFSRDMTYRFDYGDGVDKGTFKFLPDRYIAIYNNEIVGEEFDMVMTIASISETTLYLVGEETGTFKRVSE